jgi:hypothetical protein
MHPEMKSSPNFRNTVWSAILYMICYWLYL